MQRQGRKNTKVTAVQTIYIRLTVPRIWLVYGNVETIPLELSFSVTLKGDLSIKKLSEDGHVENIKFRITGNGVDETVTTDSSGQIKMQGLAQAHIQ